MAKRTCLGCGVELTGEVVTLEHARPQWLADEIKLPGVKLKHYPHDEDKPQDALLRSHELNTFPKNVQRTIESSLRMYFVVS